MADEGDSPFSEEQRQWIEARMAATIQKDPTPRKGAVGLGAGEGGSGLQQNSANHAEDGK